MKKILCLVPYNFLPAKTGGQKAIASLYEQLSDVFKIQAIGTYDNDETQAPYEVIKVFSGSAFRYINVFNFFIIAKIIKREKPDYLQIEQPYFGWLAIILKTITGVKLIVRSHNIEGLRFRVLKKWWWKLLLSYEGWVYRNADIIFFITDEDRDFAIEKFKLPAFTAHTITFGTNQIKKSPTEQKNRCALWLTKEHQLASDEIIVLFNGAFDYKPNANALYNLVTFIFPLIKNITDKKLKLIVCGKDIPDDLTKNNNNTDIIYAGFVPEINLYLLGADIFVNPITEGGGIKTKLVEALGYNLNCVSFKTGAAGIPQHICGEKLIIIEDNNWADFAFGIIGASKVTSDIPTSFFDHFSNQKIVEKVKSIL